MKSFTHRLVYFVWRIANEIYQAASECLYCPWLLDTQLKADDASALQQPVLFIDPGTVLAARSGLDRAAASLRRASTSYTFCSRFANIFGVPIRLLITQK